MKELGGKIKTGVKWSLIETIFKQIIQIIISIILARLISPSDYGLIALCAIFLSLSNILIDSGFTVALLRKLDVSEDEYNSIFWFNVILSVFLYSIIYLIAPFVSKFYNKEHLTLVIRLLSMSLVLNAITIVQRVKLSRELNFKKQALIGSFSMVLSGFLGITLAIQGQGVYSLVWQAVAGSFISVVFYFYMLSWTPIFYFNIRYVRDLFSFSSKIVINDMFTVLFNNSFYIFIGKTYSPTDLAYYSRSETTVSLITNNLTNSIKRVSYPALAKLQNDNYALSEMYNKIVRKTVFFTFPILLGMAAISSNLVLTILGAEWKQTSILLELSGFAGLFVPLIHFNLNSLNLKGKSSLYLKLQIFHKLILIPSFWLGYFYGIPFMLFAFGLLNLIYYFITSIYSSRMLENQWFSQLFQIRSFLIIAFLVYFYLKAVNYYLGIGWLSLVFEVFSSILFYLSIGFAWKIHEFVSVINVIKNKFV